MFGRKNSHVLVHSAVSHSDKAGPGLSWELWPCLPCEQEGPSYLSHQLLTSTVHLVRHLELKQSQASSPGACTDCRRPEWA